jgi:hypothetical protein
MLVQRDLTTAMHPRFRSGQEALGGPAFGSRLRRSVWLNARAEMVADKSRSGAHWNGTECTIKQKCGLPATPLLPRQPVRGVGRARIVGCPFGLLLRRI